MHTAALTIDTSNAVQILLLVVMMPTVNAIKKDAWNPLEHHQISTTTAITRAEQPLRQFMFRQTGENELSLFVNMSKIKTPQTEGQVPTYVLIPAFVMSEMKTAFQIGFLIFLPFLLVDPDEHGHGHVAPDVHIHALQDPALCPGRRLGPDRARARLELPLTRPPE